MHTLNKVDTLYKEVDIVKYTLDERLEIGRKIYCHELTINEASIEYNINNYTARDYMRFYRDKNQLPQMKENIICNEAPKSKTKNKNTLNYENLEQLTKDELIDEVIKARVDAERAKKGYLVKGDGQEKEFISINSLNLK